MRIDQLGLLVLVAAMSGCAAPESDSPGFMGNYNGHPWQSLMSKPAPRNRTNSLIQQPQYAPAQRFATQPAAGSTPPTAEVTPPAQ